VNCNWKVYVDNYLDSYHIPVVHPGLMKEIDYPRATAPTLSLLFTTTTSGEGVEAKRLRGTRLSAGIGLNEKTLTIFEWYFHDAHSEKTRDRAAKAIGFSDTGSAGIHAHLRSRVARLAIRHLRSGPLFREARERRPPLPHAFR
jgi:hypothetical protein